MWSHLRDQRPLPRPTLNDSHDTPQLGEPLVRQPAGMVSRAAHITAWVIILTWLVVVLVAVARAQDASQAVASGMGMGELIGALGGFAVVILTANWRLVKMMLEHQKSVMHQLVSVMREQSRSLSQGQEYLERKVSAMHLAIIGRDDRTPPDGPGPHRE